MVQKMLTSYLNSPYTVFKDLWERGEEKIITCISNAVFVYNRIDMGMIKAVIWAVVGFTVCPKLNSKSISERFFFDLEYKKRTR